MTGEERKRLRNTLLDLGYTRTLATPDLKSTGIYSERWVREQDGPLNNLVTIEWAAKEES